MLLLFIFFFFNDTATTEIYTLSLHDALPICWHLGRVRRRPTTPSERKAVLFSMDCRDRKSTRLNSSHQIISYAVFCLKKKIPRHKGLLAQSPHCLHPHRQRRVGSIPSIHYAI